MTPGHIDLYRQLSETKIYKERFGKWRVGDNCHDPKYQRRGIITDVRTEFTGNFMWINFGGTFLTAALDEKLIWLPPVFDPENPERCLWGMVDWDKLSDKFISTDGQMLVMRRRGEELHNIVDRLDLALIKAILKQEVKP